MKDDIVIYCIRDEKTTGLEEMAGVAYNTDHLNTMIGSVKALKESPKKDKFKLNLNIIEYDKDDKGLYCKLVHRTDTIIEHFNMTNVEVLMAKGVWIKGDLSYHGKTRNHVGIIDLSGEAKSKIQMNIQVKREFFQRGRRTHPPRLLFSPLRPLSWSPSSLPSDSESESN